MFLFIFFFFILSITALHVPQSNEAIIDYHHYTQLPLRFQHAYHIGNIVTFLQTNSQLKDSPASDVPAPDLLMPPAHKLSPYGPLMYPQTIHNKAGVWWMVPHVAPSGKVWMLPQRATTAMPIQSIRASMQLPPMPPPLHFAPIPKPWPYIYHNPATAPPPTDPRDAISTVPQGANAGVNPKNKESDIRVMKLQPSNDNPLAASSSVTSPPTSPTTTKDSVIDNPLKDIEQKARDSFETTEASRRLAIRKENTSKSDIVAIDPQSDTQANGFLLGEKLVMRISTVTLLDKTSKTASPGTLVMTNYSLSFEGPIPFPSSYLTIPLASIERIDKINERTGLGQCALEIICKDVRSVKYSFQPDQQIRQRVFDCLKAYCFPESSQFLFAFDHLAGRKFDHSIDGWSLFSPLEDYRRMGIPSKLWRLTSANTRFELCDTYPRVFAVPASVSDESLVSVANFRSRARLPVCTWLHPNGASLSRSSQPRVGLNQTRSIEDEKLLDAMRIVQSDSKAKLNVIDCRPRLNAVGNKLAGKGYEDPEFYKHCSIHFLGIDNIHIMREAYSKLSRTCKKIPCSHSHWFSDLESTGWFAHIRIILTSIRKCVVSLQQGISVLSHCSDGWDRTSQIVALTELCLDPHFRTVRGFLALIEKEFCSFGHQFQLRVGHGEDATDFSNRSPVFLQFLDTVYQLTLQFPFDFEFNSELLCEIAFHLYSCRFGTFLFNSVRERLQNKVYERTVSLWTHILSHIQETSAEFNFINPFWRGHVDMRVSVLMPSDSMKRIRLWSDFWLKFDRTVPLSVETQLQRQHVRMMKRQTALYDSISPFTEDIDATSEPDEDEETN